MKEYIKPEISITEVESQTILAGSLSEDGTTGDLQQRDSGSLGASSARSKQDVIGNLPDFWGDDVEEEE